MSVKHEPFFFSRLLPFDFAQGSLEPTENAERKILIKVLGSPRNYRRADSPDASHLGSGQLSMARISKLITVRQELPT
jgi:hypothetical protein